ncbi:MAG: LCP family protein [Lactobacillaceae bacterium]|jgi:LCP family protein required for cell wall assembly|nr:LCP family protein [Lactobacillaceae bacterium]
MKNSNLSGKKVFKKQKHTLRNSLLITFGLLSTAVVGLFVFAFFNTKGAIDKTHINLNMKKQRNVDSVLNSGKPISILLMGTDTGELGRDYTGRTDSLVVVTINPAKKQTMMVSIPRDSMISVLGNPEVFPQKINAAYEYSTGPEGFDGKGHPESTIKLIQKWLNIPIDYYALVNMSALEKVVDQIGGVDIVPPFTFDYEGVHFEGGKTQHVNGYEALKFVRMRYDDPEYDYGRTKRQRILLEAIAKNVTKIASKIVNKKFLDSIANNANTDLTFNDMLALVSKYNKAVKNIKSDHLQGVSYNFQPNDGGSAISFEQIPQDEKQRITNLIRKNLGLKKAKTGPLYGGEVPDETTVTKPKNGSADHVDNSNNNSATYTPATQSPTYPNNSGSSNTSQQSSSETPATPSSNAPSVEVPNTPSVPNTPEAPPAEPETPSTPPTE